MDSLFNILLIFNIKPSIIDDNFMIIYSFISKTGGSNNNKQKGKQYDYYRGYVKYKKKYLHLIKNK